jgi:hypothetical protein
MYTAFTSFYRLVWAVFGREKRDIPNPDSN